MVNDEIHYRILRDARARPEAQRELADSLGISVGKTNYCVRTLVEKGLLKVENFRCSRNKLAYSYHLTPTGIAAKVRITHRFLEIKRREYETLRAQIGLPRVSQTHEGGVMMKPEVSNGDKKVIYTRVQA